MKYPPPSSDGTMPTMEAFRACSAPDPAGASPSPGMDPRKVASPKLNTPPSEATNQ